MEVEQRRMLALLEGLQALTRGEAAAAVPREVIELGDVVDAAVQAARRRHPGVEISLAEDWTEAAVDGWPDGLRMLVDNLLDNAALHGRPGGRVVIGLHAAAEGSIELTVEDDGPGLPEDERRRVLEPFTRGRDARAPGTGLGLAVVAQQAAIHGGEVELSKSTMGGLRAGVTLPSVKALAGIT